MGKMILHFSGLQAAKKFVARVKQIPYVTYATDFTFKQNPAVMVCGDFTPEREEFIQSLKSHR